MSQTLCKGKILIAMPTLADPNFCQTVILLCDYGPQGAMGVILNRPTEILVSALVHDFPKIDHVEWVYDGGPVAKNGMLVLCRGYADAKEEDGRIIDGVLLAKNLESFKKNPHAFSEMRYYLGYAGWVPGQLETEVKEGAWATCSADPDLIFCTDGSALWPQMIRRLGPEWAFYATMPANPRMN